MDRPVTGRPSPLRRIAFLGQGAIAGRYLPMLLARPELALGLLVGDAGLTPKRPIAAPRSCRRPSGATARFWSASGASGSTP